MADLLIKLTSKCIPKKYLIEKKADEVVAKSFTLILNIDVTNFNLLKKLNLVFLKI